MSVTTLFMFVSGGQKCVQVSTEEPVWVDPPDSEHVSCKLMIHIAEIMHSTYRMLTKPYFSMSWKKAGKQGSNN